MWVRLALPLTAFGLTRNSDMVNKTRMKNHFAGWDAIDGSSVLKEEVDTAFAKTKSLAARMEKALGQRGRRLWRVAAAVSAAAVIAALGVFAGMRFSLNEADPGRFEIVADCGQRSEVLLPDGSRIRLNSASRISYSSGYGKTDRNIFLDGEAFFEVAKNAGLPFVVSTGNISVEALGTKFNVRSYKDGNETVTLVEGKVLTTAGETEAMLHPHQSVSYDRISGKLGQPRPTDGQSDVPWLSGEMKFRDDSLAAVAAEIERLYNVRVVFEDEKIRGFRYTGVIPNSSLNAILGIITEASPVSWKMEGNVVTLSERASGK